MKHFILTRRHILDALEVKPHVFRQWTRDLEPYRDQATKVRVSRKFNRQDLLFFCIIKSLIADFGMPTAVIARFSGNLKKCLGKPMLAISPACLFIHIPSGKVAPVRAFELESGIVIDLAPHVSRCNTFFENTGEEAEQASLPFGLTDMVEQSIKNEVVMS